MSTGTDDFQYLLQGMRAAFLDDLQERCDQCDNLLLGLEKNPEDRVLFDELYREVHSLKGSGGTHGLHIITRICHQLEDCLSHVAEKKDFSRSLERALKYVDLLRRVEGYGRMENPDYSGIEADMEVLRQSALQSRKSCLVAESSNMMSRVYQTVLEQHSIQMTLVSNGMQALSRLLHEPFDFAIIGRELQDLNGVAVISALRASHCKNEKLPVIFVSSNLSHIPEHAGIHAVLSKNNQLSHNLDATLKRMQL
jgi:chemotaxis protein histidine kinase CheA